VNLDLPPRRELPPDVRDRMRLRALDAVRGPSADRFGRLSAPVAVAAGVTVLAASAVIVAQSTGGSSDEETFAAARPSSSSRPSATTTEKPTPLPIGTLDQAKAREDLDRCAAVAAASPRAAEFAPRAAWEPVYAVEWNGHRLTAYREHGARPMFCDTTATTATVSDPSAEPMALTGAPNAPYYGLYLSPAGILAGVAQGLTGLEFDVNTLLDTSKGFTFRTRKETASIRESQFVVYVGQLKDGDELVSTAFNGGPVTSGGMRFGQHRLRPAGATAVDRP
jgi:hypothetical protein